MPYLPHRRLTMIGTMGGNNDERFSFGLSLDETFFNLQPDQDMLEDMVVKTQAFFSAPTTNIHSTAVLTMVKLAKIGADGKYLEDALFVDGLTSAGGGSSTVLHPFQVALAVSLGSARRGPTGRGRFYLPLPALVVSTDGTAGGGQLLEVQGSVKTWLEALGNREGIDPSVPSVVIASTKGYVSPVTSVRIGRVLDTIRSRRRSLNEAYIDAVQVST